MQYRKDASKYKKFSTTPPDFNHMVADYIKQSFESLLQANEKDIEIKGRLYPEEILLKISLTETNRIHCDNFSASMDYTPEKGETMDRIQDMLDSLACMLEQFLEAEGDIEMPKAWSEFEMEGRKLYMMYSTENDALEEQTRELLGEEDADALAEIDEDMLGVDFFKEAEERFRKNMH